MYLVQTTPKEKGKKVFFENLFFVTTYLVSLTFLFSSCSLTNEHEDNKSDSLVSISKESPPNISYSEVKSKVDQLLQIKLDKTFNTLSLKGDSNLNSKTSGLWAWSDSYSYLYGFDDYKKYEFKAVASDSNSSFWSLFAKIKNGNISSYKWVKNGESVPFEYLKSSFDFDSLVIFYTSYKATNFNAQMTEKSPEVSSVSASDLKFPSSDGNATGWSNTSGSSYHHAGGGWNGADDTYALDLNKNIPTYNLDGGLNVNPTYEGEVVATSASLGFVLVKHSTPLRLDDGSILSEWYSAYMHLKHIVAKGTKVDKNSVLGQVSNSSATNEHLHFCVYSGSINSLKSINTRTKLTGLSNKIAHWFIIK